MRSALRASLGESLITASVVMIMVVAVVGAALQLLVPLHLSSLGMDRTGIGLVVFGGRGARGRGGGHHRPGRRPGGRVPLAAGACAALAVLTGLFALPESLAVFVVLVVGAPAVQSILYAVGYPLSTDGADRAQLGHGVVIGVVNLMWGVGAVIGPVAGSRIAALGGGAGVVRAARRSSAPRPPSCSCASTARRRRRTDEADAVWHIRMYLFPFWKTVGIIEVLGFCALGT